GRNLIFFPSAVPCSLIHGEVMAAKAKSAARRLPRKAGRERASRPLLPPVTRVAIIGAGAGGSALLSILARDPLVRLVGIAEINPQAPGLRLAKRYGIPVVRDYKELLGSEEVDLIIDV